MKKKPLRTFVSFIDNNFFIENLQRNPTNTRSNHSKETGLT